MCNIAHLFPKLSFHTPPDYYWPFCNRFNDSLKDKGPPTDLIGPDQVQPYEHYHQSAHSPSIGTHLFHPHLRRSCHDPPYNASSNASLYSSIAVNYRYMYSPHVHTSRLRMPFLKQSTESGQAALFSEVRQISVHISTLQEGQEQLLNKMEAHINALENPPENDIGTGSRAKKTAAATRGGINDHPLVKVSQQIRPLMILISTHPFSSASYPRIVLRDV